MLNYGIVNFGSIYHPQLQDIIFRVPVGHPESFMIMGWWGGQYRSARGSLASSGLRGALPLLA